MGIAILQHLKNCLQATKSFTNGLVAELASITADAIEETEARIDALSCLYVNGTQEAATNAWTGEAKAIKALYDGMTIDYRLPYSCTSDPATLTLVLMDGITTEAIPVYRDSINPVTGQFSAGSILRLTYLEKSNRWQQSALSDVALAVIYDATRKTLTLSK